MQRKGYMYRICVPSQSYGNDGLLTFTTSLHQTVYWLVFKSLGPAWSRWVGFIDPWRDSLIQGGNSLIQGHSWHTNTGWALPLHIVDQTRESGGQCHAHSWQTNTGWALPLHIVDQTRESGGQCHAHSWQTNTGWALPLHIVDQTRESGGQCHAHSWQTNTGWALPLHVVGHTRESGGQCHAHSWQTDTGWILPLHVVGHTRESGGQDHAHSWQTNTGWALSYMAWTTPGNQEAKAMLIADRQTLAGLYPTWRGPHKGIRRPMSCS